MRLSVRCLLPVCLYVCLLRAHGCAQVGAETFRLCRQLVDGVLLVDNAAISAAIKDVFNETRSILEPAGAVAVAGAKAWLKENGHKVCLLGAGAACQPVLRLPLRFSHAPTRAAASQCMRIKCLKDDAFNFGGASPCGSLPPSPEGPSAPGQLLLCSHRPPALLCVLL